MGFLGLVGLWLAAAAMVASAVVFGWVMMTTRPAAVALAHRSRRHHDEDLVRRACADLDAEYRRLLQH